MAETEDPFAGGVAEGLEVEYEEQSAGSEPVPIAGVLKVLVVAGFLFGAVFAFMAFQPAQVTLTVSVQDTEGQPLPSNTVEVAMQGQSVQSLRGAAQYDIELLEGSYLVSVSAPGYKPSSKEVELSGGAELRFSLEKRLNIALQPPELPGALPLEAATPVPLVLRNQGTEDAEIELVFEGFDKVSAELQPARVFVPAGGEATVTLFLKPLERKSGEQEGTVRVKYTRTEQTLTYTVGPPASLKPGPRLEMEGVAGARVEGTLSFENTGGVDLPDTVFSVELDTDMEPEKAFWFSLEPANAFVSAGSRQDLNLSAHIPADAQPGRVSGRVVAESPRMGRDVSVAFQLNVLAAPAPLTVELETPITLSFDSDANAYEDKNALLSLKNDSGLVVQDLAVVLKNTGACTFQHLAFEQVTVPFLNPEETVQVLMQVSSPNQNVSRVTECRLEVDYLDPRTRNVSRILKILEIIREK